MTIVEFLIARLDEDEAVANATTSVPVAGCWKAARDKHAADGAPLFLVQGDDPHEPGTMEYTSTEIIAYSAEWQTEAEANLRHIARHDPARVLREVAAKRERLALYVEVTDILFHGSSGDRIKYQRESGRFEALDVEVRRDAAIYADHPDYKPDWNLPT